MVVELLFINVLLFPLCWEIGLMIFMCKYLLCYKEVGYTTALHQFGVGLLNSDNFLLICFLQPSGVGTG